MSLSYNSCKFFSFADRTSAPKPIGFSATRVWIIASSPTKAPPQINRILDVSIFSISWLGCLRPPCGGTEATVPSTIFSRACWTPSPETSRVIDTFSLFRAILSISSIKIIPRSARAISPSAFWISFKRIFSTSSPTYPASVKVVASAIAKGTFIFCARVRANSVFPEPVGPISKTLDFSITTAFRSVGGCIIRL